MSSVYASLLHRVIMNGPMKRSASLAAPWFVTEPCAMHEYRKRYANFYRVLKTALIGCSSTICYATILFYTNLFTPKLTAFKDTYKFLCVLCRMRGPCRVRQILTKHAFTHSYPLVIHRNAYQVYKLRLLKLL